MTRPDDRQIRRIWRWYRSPGSERVVAKEEFQGLQTHGRAALAEAIARFRRGEELPGEVMKLKGTDDLWEIRVRVGNDPFRALFFYDTDIICVCVTAFYKNQQKTPNSAKAAATKRKRSWEEEGRERERRGH